MNNTAGVLAHSESVTKENPGNSRAPYANNLTLRNVNLP
jgi:hypothetical protein